MVVPEGYGFNFPGIPYAWDDPGVAHAKFGRALKAGSLGTRKKPRPGIRRFWFVPRIKAPYPPVTHPPERPVIDPET